jgi:hypothetical protein
VPQLRRLVAGFPSWRPGFYLRSSHVGFVVDKVALGQVFSEYFCFPCQMSFHRLLHTHRLSSGTGTTGENSGRRTKWTLSHSTPRREKKGKKKEKKGKSSYLTLHNPSCINMLYRIANLMYVSLCAKRTLIIPSICQMALTVN